MENIKIERELICFITQKREQFLEGLRPSDESYSRSFNTWRSMSPPIFFSPFRTQMRKNSSRFNYLHPFRPASCTRASLAIPISLVTAASCLAAQSYLPSNLPASVVGVIPRGCAWLR